MRTMLGVWLLLGSGCVVMKPHRVAERAANEFFTAARTTHERGPWQRTPESNPLEVVMVREQGNARAMVYWLERRDGGEWQVAAHSRIFEEHDSALAEAPLWLPGEKLPWVVRVERRAPLGEDFGAAVLWLERPGDVQAVSHALERDVPGQRTVVGRDALCTRLSVTVRSCGAMPVLDVDGCENGIAQRELLRFDPAAQRFERERPVCDAPFQELWRGKPLWGLNHPPRRKDAPEATLHGSRDEGWFATLEWYGRRYEERVLAPGTAQHAEVVAALPLPGRQAAGVVLRVTRELGSEDLDLYVTKGDATLLREAVLPLRRRDGCEPWAAVSEDRLVVEGCEKATHVLWTTKPAETIPFGTVRCAALENGQVCAVDSQREGVVAGWWPNGAGMVHLPDAANLVDGPFVETDGSVRLALRAMNGGVFWHREAPPKFERDGKRVLERISDAVGAVHKLADGSFVVAGRVRIVSGNPARLQNVSAEVTKGALAVEPMAGPSVWQTSDGKALLLGEEVPKPTDKVWFLHGVLATPHGLFSWPEGWSTRDGWKPERNPAKAVK